MRDLSLLICQCDIEWEAPKKNLERIESLLEGYMASDTTIDLVILPEFFSMGFTMNREAVILEGGESVRWMKSFAQKWNVAIYGSIPTIDSLDGKMYNRGYFLYPDGRCEWYDKRHLFRMGGESDVYSAGGEKKIVEYKGWRIALNICYDLRFPVWSRNVNLEYDILINIASWPASRISVTEPLIKARAVENMAYTIFCNRVGDDPTNHYNGLSRCITPRGEDLLEGRLELENISILTLMAEPLLSLRERFHSWKDGDNFTINE